MYCSGGHQQSYPSMEIVRSESRASISHEQTSPVYHSPTRYILRSHTNDNRDVKRARQQVFHRYFFYDFSFFSQTYGAIDTLFS